ncbi:MAG TPA: hypothetical protein VIT62_03900 [Lysobacter sp.]
MTPAQVRHLANSIASMLVSHAAHGVSTSSLSGTGEITLRDGLVVSAASVGSSHKQAWILNREVIPTGWDGAVDLVVCRVSNGTEKIVGGVELKFWRQATASNASNRRRDLFKDFMRAAALYPLSEHFSFVALLTTKESWDTTVGTRGADKDVIDLLKAEATVSWNIASLSGSPSIKSAAKLLKGKVPVISSFKSELMCTYSLSTSDGAICAARVWAVRKPQNTRELTEAELEAITRNTK